MRGRKATTGNKLNASHDSRTSCPPTTRKRKDSNTRLPPIHPNKNRVPTKPPAPVSLQQITTKLPPAAKKPAPTRGRPSNKRQTTTTTTTTITSVSKSPQISDTTTTTLPSLPSVTGHGIFTGAAAAATAAAIGTAAINMDDLIGTDEPENVDEPVEVEKPRSPVLETQKTFDRSSPTQQAGEEVPTDILDNLADESEKVAEQEEQEFIPRQIVLDNTPINHGDYEDSDSEPEYAEEDRETPEAPNIEEVFIRQEIGQAAASPTEPLAVHIHSEAAHVSPPVSDNTQESPKELSYQHDEPSPVLPSPGDAPKDAPEEAHSPIQSVRSGHRTPPTLIFTDQSTEDAPKSPEHFEHREAQQSPVVDVHSTHVVEHFESHDATPQSPVSSVHGGAAVEHEEEVEVPQSPVLSVHSSHNSEHHETELQSPVASEHQSEPHEPAPQSPVLSIHSSHHSEHQSEHEDIQSASEHHEPAPQSPVLSIHSSHHSEHHEQVLQSPVASEHHSEHHEPAPQSPVLSVHSSHHTEHHDQSPPGSPAASDKDAVELSPSIYSSQASEQSEQRQDSPVASERSARSARSPTFESSVTMQESYASENDAPVASEHDQHEATPRADEHHHEPAPHSPVASVFERAPSIRSQGSDDFEHVQAESAPKSPVASEGAHSPAPQSPLQEVRAPSEQEVHHQEPAPQSPAQDGIFERASSVHGSHTSAPMSPAASEKEVHFQRAPSTEGSHHHYSEQEEPAPQSPVLSVHSSHHSEQHSEHVHADHEVPRSPVLSVHSEHQDHHEPAPQSPVLSVHSSHASEHAAPQSPASSDHVSEEQYEKIEHIAEAAHPTDHINLTDIPKSPVLSMNDSYAPDHLELEAIPHSPAAAPEPESHSPEPSEKDAQFAPRSPSVHTSDAEEDTFEVQHHAALTHTSAPSPPVRAPQSPTEMDLYNPSRENQPSPVMSEPDLPAGILIADRIDLEAYHNSPTKESTSPVVVNPVDHPMEVQISAEQVAEQLSTPEQKQNFEDIINKSADEEASHLIQEALTEAPAIIDMVNTYEEKEKFPEAYELKYKNEDEGHSPVDNAMMTSIYQPSSDHEDHDSNHEDHKVIEEHKPTIEVKEWDEGDHHVKESTTVSDFTDGTTHMTFQEKVTIVSDNGHEDHSENSKVSPKSEHDNISTDSLIIHDDVQHQSQPSDFDNQMTQSIYQPHDEETEEKEWDDGNKHVHETVTNSEFTDESGKHYSETVTTTTTVIKSGDDDLKNNNDEDDQDGGSDNDDKDKIIEEEEELGSNGNHVRETITTTTRTVTSGGIPEGGILVDDGDETNISSL
ncbi:hypothetical protein GCK72_022814 [Caenorhabditis remanei]|uniref:Uncharacterized protein n=1 Tax=Caenorhabditis remanei TaxID=31234 RepID=A0A6A5FVC7_CAERE|nr:hypothetical protein GCK72_022814 [Caenorhabditis remanei]KAF1746361.1 hypothetical protein GCK72_022814 [Caenorhabditis remanei]